MDFSNINFLALSGLVTFFTSFIIGSLVYLQGRKDQTNIAFAIFSLTVALWSISYMFWAQSTEYNTGLLWGRILMVPTLFISVTFFHFVLALLGQEKGYKRILIGSYLFFSFFLFFSFSPLFIKTVDNRIVPPFYWPQPGALASFFLFIWGLYFVWGTVLLFRSYKKADKVKKAQIRYVLAGVLVGYITGSTNFLPWYGIAFPTLTIGVSFYVLMFGYAVFKHHLFNIRLITIELLTFIIWAFVLGRLLTGGQSSQEFISNILLSCAVIIIGIFIIRAGLIEAKQKELLSKLNTDLDDLNQNLQKKVDEQTKDIRTAYEVEKKARVELEHLNRAKNDFILAAQHNLRTPLTVAKGYVQEIDSHFKEGSTEKLEESVGKTTGALDTMTKLVNGLLDITELKVGTAKSSNSKEEKF